jgi:hypothetical protein
VSGISRRSDDHVIHLLCRHRGRPSKPARQRLALLGDRHGWNRRVHEQYLRRRSPPFESLNANGTMQSEKPPGPRKEPGGDGGQALALLDSADDRSHSDGFDDHSTHLLCMDCESMHYWSAAFSGQSPDRLDVASCY